MNLKTTVAILITLLSMSCIVQKPERNNIYDPAEWSWKYIGSPNFNSGQAYSLAMACSETGVLHVAFQDGYGGKATVMKFNGTSWVHVGSPSFSAGSATNVAIAFYNGEPYVAFKDGANSGKATVMKFNGTSWALVGSAGFSSPLGFTQDKHRDIAIAFDANGVLYVAFLSGGGATVMTNNGATWNLVGAAGFATGYSIALSIYNSEPYVAAGSYSDKANVKKFNGSSWVSIGAANFSTAGADYISLAVCNGTPYVAYSDASIQRPALMRYTGSSWSSFGSAILYNITTELTMNTNNYPIIASGNSVYKYDGTTMNDIGPGYALMSFGLLIAITTYNGRPYFGIVSDVEKKISIMGYW